VLELGSKTAADSSRRAEKTEVLRLLDMLEEAAADYRCASSVVALHWMLRAALTTAPPLAWPPRRRAPQRRGPRRQALLQPGASVCLACKWGQTTRLAIMHNLF
jgi:hypothetical protein